MTTKNPETGSTEPDELEEGKLISPEILDAYFVEDVNRRLRVVFLPLDEDED